MMGALTSTLGFWIWSNIIWDRAFCCFRVGCLRILKERQRSTSTESEVKKKKTLRKWAYTSTMTKPGDRPMQSSSAHESKEVIASSHVVREHVPAPLPSPLAWRHRGRAIRSSASLQL
ncbi:hypothetical protein EDB81DRAFT_442214 [Dactylonectria macrodidyma]|uniref:Secreted protein n=1 Tax=Dactylonectria macrodidyma TaxID=307937 RepID=A0A9P9F4L9_9HYPO|nr:hypothetical protein EDB81DRAFT_442214 [Dactylonectria macrodidyma]